MNYPGYQHFAAWLESQFPHIIQPGTEQFLRQFHLNSDDDVLNFSTHGCAYFLEFLGPEIYDMARTTLAEIKVIQEFLYTQDPNAAIHSYMDFFEFREGMKDVCQVYYPESSAILDKKAFRNSSHSTHSARL